MLEDFRELKCYSEARELRRAVADVVRDWPAAETYRLKDQMIRASRSVTANIAEGYGRHHHRENLQFCRQARGSLYEILDHISAAHDEGLLPDPVKSAFEARITTCLKLLNGYISYLKKRAG